MKTPTLAGCATLLLLLLALCSPTSSAPGAVNYPGPCCEGHGKRLPLNLIERYYNTDSSCSLPAVVFITKKGRALCANPAEQWVRDRMRDLDRN